MFYKSLVFRNDASILFGRKLFYLKNIINLINEIIFLITTTQLLNIE
jgi:hypothetical protein